MRSGAVFRRTRFVYVCFCVTVISLRFDNDCNKEATYLLTYFRVPPGNPVIRFTTQCYAEHGIAAARRPSSVCDVEVSACFYYFENNYTKT